MNEFKIGDSIFHKSNSTIKWIIERVDDNEVYCSTVIKDTLEQKKEVFSLTSIEKCGDHKVNTCKTTRNHHY